jgi:translation initiation factor 2 subunit 2
MDEEQHTMATKPADDDDILTFDVTMKKKKKKKPTSSTTPDEPLATADATLSCPTTQTGYAFKDYTYTDLLSRVFSTIRENNPEASLDRKKFSIVPPVIAREGSKKTSFSNIVDFCRRMGRPVEHLTSFLLAELATTGSSDQAGRLLIRGRFQQLQVESVLKRYIQEYVTCKTCRAPETHLVKDNTSRLMFIECEKCSSRRSVAPIKSGMKKQ